MRRNGLQHFVEILPNRTIICGHQRVRAARLLGWTSITCWVRDDLEAAGEIAIERRLIEDNLHRRQLSKLEQARCYRNLRELAEHEESMASDDDNQLLTVGKKRKRGDTRDVLAERFDKSGRTMDRWERVLDTPIEVQAAYEQKRISFAVAEKVAGLRPADQAGIAKRIREGEEPKAVIGEYLPQTPVKAASVGTALGCLTRAIDQACTDLQGRTDKVPYSESDYEALERSQPLIRQLLSSMAANRDRFQRALAACRSVADRQLRLF
jgi:hypothetical protein